MTRRLLSRAIRAGVALVTAIAACGLGAAGQGHQQTEDESHPCHSRAFSNSGDRGEGEPRPPSRRFARVNALPLGGTFGEAQPLVEQGGDAGVDDAVPDAEPVAAAGEDAAVRQPLELVRDRLGLHLDGGGEVADARLARPCQGVEEPEAGVIRQDLVDGHEAGGLFGRQERSLVQCGLIGLATHGSASALITLFNVIVVKSARPRFLPEIIRVRFLAATAGASRNALYVALTE